MKKEKLYRVFSLIWIIIFAIMGVCYLFSGKGGEVSETENRTLALSPDFYIGNVINGNISDETEAFLSDHILWRGGAMGLYNRIKDGLSFASYEDSLAVMNGGQDALTQNVVDQEDMENRAQELLESLEAQQEQQAMQEQQGLPEENEWVKPAASKSVEEFDEILQIRVNDYEYMSFTKSSVLAFTGVLNRAAALLPEDGKLIYTMIPNSVAGNMFVASPAEGGFVSEAEELVDIAGSRNVRALNAAEVLGAGVLRNDYVYFRTDMHYTAYGTWLIYSEMAEMAGLVPAQWEEFEITSEEPFLGTLYRDYPTDEMAANPDRLDLVLPPFDVSLRRIDGVDSWHEIPMLDFNAASTDRFTIYLGGPAGPWSYVECENGIARKCLVICDSFGLSFVPQICMNYGEVHYLDPRYYDYWTVGYTVKEMIENYGISDIYVVLGDVHSYNSDFILYQLSEQLGD